MHPLSIDSAHSVVIFPLMDSRTGWRAILPKIIFYRNSHTAYQVALLYLYAADLYWFMQWLHKNLYLVLYVFLQVSERIMGCILPICLPRKNLNVVVVELIL